MTEAALRNGVARWDFKYMMEGQLVGHMEKKITLPLPYGIYKNTFQIYCVFTV